MTKPSQSAAAALGVLYVAQQWQISDHDLCVMIGDATESTIGIWRQRVENQKDIPKPLTDSQLERASHIIGIHAELQELFPVGDQAARWVHRQLETPEFDGHSAINIMRRGDVQDMGRIREFLRTQNEMHKQD